jgi:hypothetical protein
MVSTKNTKGTKEERNSEGKWRCHAIFEAQADTASANMFAMQHPPMLQFRFMEFLQSSFLKSSA